MHASVVAAWTLVSSSKQMLQLSFSSLCGGEGAVALVLLSRSCAAPPCNTLDFAAADAI